MLDRALTLTDLTLFGVASIVGSGGFNLVGKAVRAGGSWWPVAFLISAVLLMGAAYAYTEAFSTSGKNTAESDIVASVFGPVGESASIFAILVFNIVSISTILVFCAQLLIPGHSWIAQVGTALAALGGMAGFSLAGIELNKVTINAIAYVMVAVLAGTACLGFYGLSMPPAPLPTGTSFTTSLLLIFFILAGFDNNMKFAEEAVDPADIPRSFFTSNVISVVLVAGVALAIQYWLPTLTAGNESNALGHLLSVFAGSWALEPTKYLMIAFMITTTFIIFLSQTRYLFGLGQKFSGLSLLKEVNSASVPYNTVALVTVLAGLAILINHTETLVKISDVGVIGLLGLVATAAAVTDFGAGSFFSSLVNGATATGFAGLLGVCVL
jgi:APA family basic amino acid/polyamine antiporter